MLSTESQLRQAFHLKNQIEHSEAAQSLPHDEAMSRLPVKRNAGRVSKVVWQPEALWVVEANVNRLASDKPISAEVLVGLVEHALEKLVRNPTAAPAVPELERLGVFGYREFNVSPFRVICRTTGESFVVVLVIDLEEEERRGRTTGETSRRLTRPQ